MTYTCLVFLLWSRHVPFTSREAVGQMLLGSEFNLKTFLRQIVGLVFGIEAVAAILLHLHDPVAFHPFSAVFHAVSAFCNARIQPECRQPHGLSGRRCGEQHHHGLCFLGGIGFAVLRETLGLLSCGRMGAPVTCFSRFSRLVVKTSIFLILTGSSLVFCMEFLRSGNEHTLGQGFDLAITAFFQSVVARTAGFNTVNVAALSEATLLVYMALMFIGGAPGSCAGGIKVVTFRVLAGYIAAQFRGDREIVLEERSVPRSNVTRALTLFFLYTTLISLSVFLLSITENGILRGAERDRVSLMSILFEEISALGTVGLSVGLTPLLSSEGKAVIILNMFAGRVGLISLLMAVQSLRPKKFYTHAEAQLPIG